MSLIRREPGDAGTKRITCTRKTPVHPRAAEDGIFLVLCGALLLHTFRVEIIAFRLFSARITGRTHGNVRNAAAVVNNNNNNHNNDNNNNSDNNNMITTAAALRHNESPVYDAAAAVSVPLES